MILPSWWPWLASDRADVLAAIALAMRQREPLAAGLGRLAVGDPLLTTWCDRLRPDLLAGLPLGQVLCRHRLVDVSQAAALDQAADPVAAIEAITTDTVSPVPGLALVRAFPTALVATLLAPLLVLTVLGIPGIFREIYRELGMHLPDLTGLLVGEPLTLAAFLVLAPLGTAAVQVVLAHVRGVRHLPHLWWVSVHREAALLTLFTAARTGADRPRHLGLLGSAFAALRWSVRRQNRPDWDPAWRTFRILTRWRALGPGWRAASRADTAAAVLTALGILPLHATPAVIEAREQECRDRLARHARAAAAQARGGLLIAAGAGTLITVIALFLPLFRVMESLGGSGDSSSFAAVGIFGGIAVALLVLLLIPQAVWAVICLLGNLRQTGDQGILLARLAAATRQRQPWPQALRELRLVLPWPWPWLVGRAASRLDAGTTPGEVLARGDLLPVALGRQGAETLAFGPEAFVAWCERAEASTRHQSAMVHLGTVLVFEFAAIAGVVHFVVWMIFPKFIQIFRELAVTRVEPVLRWLEAAGPAELPVLLGFIALVVVGAALAGRLHWRRVQRVEAAHLILRGTAAGLPEAALGRGGDFPAVCAAAGWTAATPAALARAVAAAEAVSRRRAAWLPAAASLAAPVILALPVGAMAILLMHLLLTILTSVEVGV